MISDRRERVKYDSASNEGTATAGGKACLFKVVFLIKLDILLLTYNHCGVMKQADMPSCLGGEDHATNWF